MASMPSPPPTPPPVRMAVPNDAAAKAAADRAQAQLFAMQGRDSTNLSGNDRNNSVGTVLGA